MEAAGQIEPQQMPDPEVIRAWIDKQDHAPHLNEIARHFGLKGEQRRALRSLLHTSDGSVTGDRLTEEQPAPPRVFLAEIIAFEDDQLILQPKTAAFQHARFALKGQRHQGRVLEVSEQCLVSRDEEADTDDDALPRVRLIRVISNPKRPRLCRISHAFGQELMAEPVDGKGSEFRIHRKFAGQAEPGDLVMVTPTSDGASRGPATGRVTEHFGKVDDPKAAGRMAALEHGLRISFPEEVIALANSATSVDLAGRKDLRDLPFVTIDGADARDFDDAVYASSDDATDNQGGWRLWVAIADVAHYVRKGDALDEEALLRGNSTYFPDFVIPMLPEALSNGLCSLRPDEDRACLAVEITIGPRGALKTFAFHRGLMRSHARLTYEQVEAVWQQDDATGLQTTITKALQPLFGAYASLVEAREKRSPLDLDLDEMGIQLGDDGEPVDVSPRKRLTSHQLIEECMIAANICAAKALEHKNAAFLSRVHERPDQERLGLLHELSQRIGLSMARDRAPLPRDFNELIRKSPDVETAQLLSMLILRSQAQAHYSQSDEGHYGLQLTSYAHFTSPIRRYADLTIHRALIQTLGLENSGDGHVYDTEQLTSIGESISAHERRSAAAERDVIARLTARFMQDKVGAVFEGAIASVQKFGLFVRLNGISADGLVPVRELSRNFLQYHEDKSVLFDPGTSQVFAPMDPVSVRIVESDPVRGQMRFELVEHTSGVYARALDRRALMKQSRHQKKSSRFGPKGRGRKSVKRRS